MFGTQLNDYKILNKNPEMKLQEEARREDVILHEFERLKREVQKLGVEIQVLKKES